MSVESTALGAAFVVGPILSGAEGNAAAKTGSIEYRYRTFISTSLACGGAPMQGVIESISSTAGAITVTSNAGGAVVVAGDQSLAVGKDRLLVLDDLPRRQPDLLAADLDQLLLDDPFAKPWVDLVAQATSATGTRAVILQRSS